MAAHIFTLNDPQARDPALVGAKAARLAQLAAEGWPVPPAFIIPPGLPCTPDMLAQAFARSGLAPDTTVAVRSSAANEDGETASQAGQFLSRLHVRGFEAVCRAVEEVRRSASNGVEMAVLVQQQVNARVAGVAFGRHPTEGDTLLVEMVEGVADTLLSGTTDGVRLTVRGDTITWEGAPLLPEDVVRELAALVRRAEERFGVPQDLEWAWDGERLWVVQVRPITAFSTGFFTHAYGDDEWLWTAAFLNERLPHPVSPFGWSLVADGLEWHALRWPLILLGADDIDGPLWKLWNGHPYVRVAVWQRLYKLFPAWLLPEDARRYFPQGDVNQRRIPSKPRWGVHLVRNAWLAFRTDGRMVLPWANAARWSAFERRLQARLVEWRVRMNALALLEPDDTVQAARQLLAETQSEVHTLLRLHRWSLLYAEVGYTLLLRLLRLRHRAPQAAERAAAYTRGLDTSTTRLNKALAHLAALATPDDLALLRAAPTCDEAAARLGETPFAAALRDFTHRFGHRFFTLDCADPPLAEAPAALADLLATARDTPLPPPEPPPFWLRAFVRWLRGVLRLREEQRFAWQCILAVQRRLALTMWRAWQSAAPHEAPQQPAHIFGLTFGELLTADLSPALARLATARMRERERLLAAWKRAPNAHFPTFLRGNKPLVETHTGDTWQGRPVSPGVAQGRVRIVRTQQDLVRVQPGEVVVAPTADPGWAPMFEQIAALVTEHGSLLSHAAVLAREYGVPTVMGVHGIVEQVADGDMVLVDAYEGNIVRLKSA
ncbi:PEP/pyruvate-binding domain-containing protein [Ardenticatena maritima]|uniref:Pyruvate, water dikinase n=3 Tax=Ardenticatena maritima TaxID=872965 RepID=A0A0P6Y3E1_9CHLR|nr:PEP/pyruvate-binding domain-containing protein [Ardenticatena maritima]KPL87099.1 hypothetical protein SE16_11090 [Ardenticatena maritima]